MKTLTNTNKEATDSYSIYLDMGTNTLDQFARVFLLLGDDTPFDISSSQFYSHHQHYRIRYPSAKTHEAQDESSGLASLRTGVETSLRVVLNIDTSLLMTPRTNL